MTAFYKCYHMLVSKRRTPFHYACESHWFWENYCSFHKQLEDGCSYGNGIV